MRRVILVTNPDKPKVRQVGLDFLEWLVGQVEVVGHNLESELDYENLPDADMIISLGGDGTLLHTVRQCGECQIPLLGVNMGKLGFLAEFSMNQVKEDFQKILHEPLRISERIMLDCRVWGPGRDEHQTIAVNELAVIAGPPFRMLEVSVSIADKPLAVCLGDGLIVSTPTGSTAYNLSAGGPILDPVLDAAVITPLAAHSLSFRPVVVNLEEPILIQAGNSRIESGSNKADGHRGGATAVMVVDGQDYLPLSSEDRIEIKRSQAVFQLVSNPLQNQWQLLNTKFHWGATPTYQSIEVKS